MRKKTKDDNENEGLFEDPRFAHLQNDTRYKVCIATTPYDCANFFALSAHPAQATDGQD